MTRVTVQTSRRLPAPSERHAQRILAEEGAKSARQAANVVKVAWSFSAPKGRPRVPAPSDRGQRQRYSASIRADDPRVVLTTGGQTRIVADVYSTDPKAGYLERGVRSRRIKVKQKPGRGGGLFLSGAGGIIRQSVQTGRPAGRYSRDARRATAPAVRAIYQAGAKRAAARLKAEAGR